MSVGAAKVGSKLKASDSKCNKNGTFCFKFLNHVVTKNIKIKIKEHQLKIQEIYTERYSRRIMFNNYSKQARMLS